MEGLNVSILDIKEFFNKIGYDWDYDVGFMGGFIKAKNFSDIQSTYLTKRVLLSDNSGSKVLYQVYINKYCFKIYSKNINGLFNFDKCNDYSKNWQEFLCSKKYRILGIYSQRMR